MQSTLLVCVILPCLLLLSIRPAAAQITDSTLVARFQLAESYMRAAQFQRAIALLEDLYKTSPETRVFYDRLRSAYENVKRYDEAIRLVDHMIETTESPAVYRVEKARLLYLKGEEDEAESTWLGVLESENTTPAVYLMVYRSVMQVRLFDLAIRVLVRGRAALRNTDLFANDLAQLYNLTSQPGKAVSEYIRLLETNGTQLNFVKARLATYFTDESVLPASIAGTEAAVARDPLNRSFRELLAWLYVEAERFRDALQVYRAVDRLEDEQGRGLFSFAQIASEAGAFDVASDVYHEILERYPESVSAADAVRGLGIMLESWAIHEGAVVTDADGDRVPNPRFDLARDTYRTFLRKYPTNAFYPDVLRRMGRLTADVFFDIESAEESLREVVSRYPNTLAADEAAFDIGRLELYRGDLTQSELQFSRLITRLRTGEMADRARFELAMLDFYRGNFESALSLTAALQENTSADVANDAIALKLLLIENRGPDSLDTPLHMFAQARLLRRQRHRKEAFAELDSLLNRVGDHPLVDDVQFEQAEILRDEGQSAEAVSRFLQIPMAYPNSFLVDRSLLEAARLQATALGDTDAALQTYTRILTEHPSSLLVAEARRQIRHLRGEGA